MKPHKHAEAIKAWADGAEIEYRAQGSQEWKPIFEGWSWDNSLVAECRIKPEDKKPVVRWQWAYPTMKGWSATNYFYDDKEILNAIHDGCIKLEYTRTEFPE